MSGRNLAASVRARLLQRARDTGRDFNLVLTRFALERLLYRLGISPHAGQFLLKGALLFDLWFDVPHRPTRDADFLGFGPATLSHVAATFREICALTVADGIQFLPETLRAEEIRKDANYAGVRVLLLAILDGARCTLQLDIGFGDAVTPAPLEVDYPVMLPEFAAPRLRVYPRDSVVAEKFEALTTLGIANSRMKDYFDLWILARHSDFDGAILRQAIQATFQRRQTALTGQVPFGLTADFAADAQKQSQWRAFLHKNRLQAPALAEVLHDLRLFLLPVYMAASHDAPLAAYWPAGGPWRDG